MSAPVQPEPWHAPFSKPPAPWYADFLRPFTAANDAIRKIPGLGPTLDKAGADLDHTFSSKQAFTEAMKGFLTPGETPLMGAVAGRGASEAERILSAVVRVGGREFEGPNHAVALMAAQDAGLNTDALPIVDGFRTNRGRFLTRDQASYATKRFELHAEDLASGGTRLTRKPENSHRLDEMLGQAGAGADALNRLGGKAAMSLHAALEKDGGFSFDPRAAQFVKSGGVMVGGVPGQQGMVVNKVTLGVLKEFAKKNADLLAQDGMMMGGWRDADGKIYLDVSQKVPHAEAPALLKARGEKAGWDLDAGAEVVNPHANGAMSAGSEPPQVKQEDFAAKRADPIVAAAIRTHDGQMFTGITHADAIDQLEAAGHGALADRWRRSSSRSPTGEEGFVTRSGQYLSREQAHAELGRRPVSELMKLPPKAEVPSQQSDLFHAPAVITRQGWKPTERGVFDRSAPANQGTAPVDPRMNASMPRGGVSPLIEAIGESPTVERGLLADTEAGLPMGGHSWYETGPVKASFEGKGPLTFDDWVNAGGSGSIQNPTHNEPASASILLYAKKHGISVEEAMAEFERRFPRASTPWMSKGIASNFRRADEVGMQLPSGPGAGERKVPWYSHGKQGGSLEGHPALDTHERRRLLQLGLEDPSILRKLTNAGLHKDPMGVIPITNGLEYEALGRPYQRIAHNLGLPSTQAAQAGRWLGGGHHTGLASQPFGDYVQTLEDGLLYTARTRGLDESPKALRSLWDAISQGEDFFMPLYSRKGGYPVY